MMRLWGITLKLFLLLTAVYNITGSNERSDLKILATSYIRPPMDFLSAGCVYSSSTCNLITENMIYGFASAFCDYYFDLAN